MPCPALYVLHQRAATCIKLCPASDMNVKMKQVLDAPGAKQLVEKWQSVKAQALGGEHNVGVLSEILDGYMLSQWKARARDVKQHGWYV